MAQLRIAVGTNRCIAYVKELVAEPSGTSSNSINLQTLSHSRIFARGNLLDATKRRASTLFRRFRVCAFLSCVPPSFRAHNKTYSFLNGSNQRCVPVTRCCTMMSEPYAPALTSGDGRGEGIKGRAFRLCIWEDGFIPSPLLSHTDPTTLFNEHPESPEMLQSLSSLDARVTS